MPTIANSTSDPLYTDFLSPGPLWRGKPFWSWNGELREDELLRQVHVLREMGMGGFFMHSRTGLVTEYLGDEWFRLINACADEAARLGMEAWLYDEDRWPSGTAGGLVTEDPAHRLHFVRLTTVPAGEFAWEDAPAELIAAFVCRLGGENGQHVTDLLRVEIGGPLSETEGRTVLLFSVEELAKWTFYNGFTYVDTMSRAATEAFLRITHEQYVERCGDRLGTSIKGIFTDEPHRGAAMSGFSVSNPDAQRMAPWTAALPDEYRARFESDLLDDLPAIFLQRDGEAVSPAKWRYIDLTQQLFLENFLKPLYEWCAEHNLRLTGHTLHEDTLASQTAMQGGMMRSYEWMHAPGIDILTEGNRAFWAAKQLQSAARQTGKKWLLSELYGVTGWQFPLFGHKAVGDWQALLGINLRCHHLSWYTMAGEAKRDYPASILHQSAWWRDYDAIVETYFARLGLLLSQGDRICDLLVLHPIESVNAQVHCAWVNTLSAADPNVQALEKQFSELFGWLTGARIDFDYGDEEMISRLAAVEGREFRIGEAAYRTVLVGGLTTLRSSTLRLLEQFAERGGRVIFAGVPPAYVDAEPSPAPALLATRDNVAATTWDRESVCHAAGEGATFRIDVNRAADNAEAECLLAQVRAEGGDRRIVALLNTDREKGLGPVRIRLHAAERLPAVVEEWDCRAGIRYRLATERDEDGSLSWQTTFAPGGEHVYVLTETSDAPPKPKWETVEEVTVTGPYAYTLGEPNVLVLDTAALRLNDGAEHAPQEILKADRALRAELGLRHRSGHMIQPWYRRRTEPEPPVLGRVTLRFEFIVETLPAGGPVFLAVERPDRCQVTLNDTPLDTASPDGWWVDIAFSKLPVPAGALHVGLNTVTLVTDFTADHDLEAVYLLGDFGVRLSDDKKSAVVTALPARLSPGNLVEQGLPFYGGTVTLKIPLPRPPSADETTAVWLDGLDAACAKIVTDSGKPSYLAFPPLLAPFDYPASGVIGLEIALTRRNTFGPLHQLPLHTSGYGPGNWVTTGDQWTDAYNLWPNGLPSPPSILYRRPRTKVTA